MDKKQNNLEWSNVNNNLITDFTPPKRLSGYLLTPREPTASRSLVCEEDLEDTKNEFENPRQKLKHYLLCGKKFYIRKSNGSVTVAKTEHSHPLGMVVSTHFRCGKGVKRGLKNGALPFKID